MLLENLEELGLFPEEWDENQKSAVLASLREVVDTAKAKVSRAEIVPRAPQMLPGAVPFQGMQMGPGAGSFQG